MEKQIAELISLLKKNAPKHCTSVNIFVTCKGHKIEYTERTPKQLQQEGVSMKNINGKWIE